MGALNKKEIIRKNFAALIMGRRKLKGYSQEQLAEYANLSVSTITRIENAKSSPSFSSICQLAEAFGELPGDLFQELVERVKLEHDSNE